MKKLLGLALIFISLTGFAKLRNDQFIYMNTGFSVGNFFGGQIGINYAVNQKYSLQAEYSGVMRKAKSLPPDYNLGLLDLFSFGSIPRDNAHSLRLMAGTVKSLNNTGTIRINLEVGISFLTFKEPYNWENRDAYLWTSNYAWDYKKKHVVGAILKPDFEFTLSNFAGFSVSPYLELNGKISLVGLGINAMLGKIRIKPTFKPDAYY